MWRKLATLTLVLLIPLAAACGQRVSGDGPAVARQAVPAPAAAAPGATAAAQTQRLPVVVFLGDSLTAGLGLNEDQAYPSLLGKKLQQEGLPVRVINAGVSGDTTAGGLARLDWLLKQHPDVVVVALGGNDGLRGLPVEEADHNLREIVRRCQEAGARVLLLGLQMPHNYGPEYTTRFAAMYPKIAKDLNAALLPFMLAGVGGIARLNQMDGIHPTAAGQEIVAKNVLPYLEKVVRELAPKA
ncbi:MAG TPA: arylesterase [Thermoanaerobaculia bacterium]|jgi:acyl-CoA thioesterase-1|nr:arylesterase [Thermoanaerobaculia bacterium]